MHVARAAARQKLCSLRLWMHIIVYLTPIPPGTSKRIPVCICMSYVCGSAYKRMCTRAYVHDDLGDGRHACHLTCKDANYLARLHQLLTIKARARACRHVSAWLRWRIFFLAQCSMPPDPSHTRYDDGQRMATGEAGVGGPDDAHGHGRYKGAGNDPSRQPTQLRPSQHGQRGIKGMTRLGKG